MTSDLDRCGSPQGGPGGGGSENFIRWMPGKETEMVSDGFTKWADNGVLLQVLQEGTWSLVDTEDARQLRLEAAEHKRRHVQKAKRAPTP